jgi:hypothetical protein
LGVVSPIGYREHITLVPFSIDNAGMVFLDYIVVFALHIQHRPMLYAFSSFFPNLLLFHSNVSSWYEVGWEEVVLEDAEQDSRMYEVDMDCGYGSS